MIIPIVKQEADKESVEGAAHGLASALQEAGIRSQVDATPGKSPGWKFNEYELKVSPQQLIDLAATLQCSCLPECACLSAQSRPCLWRCSKLHFTQPGTWVAAACHLHLCHRPQGVPFEAAPAAAPVAL